MGKRSTVQCPSCGGEPHGYPHCRKCDGEGTIKCYLPDVGEVMLRARFCADLPFDWPHVAYDGWTVEKLTPKGHWLTRELPKQWEGAETKTLRRWSSNHGVFAWASKPDALASLKVRTVRRLELAHAQMRAAREAALFLGILSTPQTNSPAGAAEGAACFVE